MYRSYTLNSYLNSINKADNKEEPNEPTNKPQNASFTNSGSTIKYDAQAETKQVPKNQNASFTSGTVIKTQPRTQQTVREPIREAIRYQKLSSVTPSSQAKPQVEPTKHQILSSGNSFRVSSNSKAQQPTFRNPIIISSSIKVNSQINEPPKQQTFKNQTIYSTPPAKVVNPETRTQPSESVSVKTTVEPVRIVSRDQRAQPTQPTIVKPQQTPVKKVEPEKPTNTIVRTESLSSRPANQNQNPNDTGPQMERKDSLRYMNAIEQSNLFSEFKIKYDELKMNYDKLRQEHDDVTRQKKKIQIKFLNSNPEYYEKQIKRLRAEVQKYQEENQDNKYRFLQAQNGRKQYEASFKVKQQELKVILKQLQKQKISNVELKYQNDEKERVFGRIKNEFERSNDTTLKNYDDAVSKVNKLDGALKTRNAQYEQLQKNYERTQRRLNQIKDEHKKYKEINEEKVRVANKTIQTKNLEFLKIRSELNSKIDELSEEIQKYKSERVSTELLKTRKTQELSIIKSNRQLELDVVRLEDRVRFLEYELIQKDEMIIELQKTIDKIKVEDQIKDLENKILGLHEQKENIKREHQKVKGQLIRQIDHLRIQLMRAPQTINHVGGNANFQQILRVQLEQNAKLKRELSQKIDQVYNLKSDIDEIKVQKSNLESEMDVLKKIKKSEQKNVKLEAEIASQHIKNDIQSYKRKIELLEQKLNLKTKQVKQKDTFIMNSVLGRCKPEETPLILADFQRIFQANYVQKIAEVNQRIQDLSQSRK